jgi:hypothetical protein
MAAAWSGREDEQILQRIGFRKALQIDLIGPVDSGGKIQLVYHMASVADGNVLTRGAIMQVRT